MKKNMRPRARVARKGERCGKGWTTVEMKVNNRVRRVCVRRPATGRPRKGKDSTAQWIQSALDALTGLAHGLSHH